MTTGFVLVFAILLVGGVIATLGDRIGMRVGKARLSLFNLRPRQTATLISILTGGVISTTTLAILFLIDDQLRTGVFELEEIQDDLATARQDLQATQSEKDAIEADLEQAITQQNTAQRRLREINQSLEAAIERQGRTAQRLDRTLEELNQTEANFRQAQDQLQVISAQTGNLRSEIQQLQADRQQLIAERDQQIADREVQIAERDQQIAEREVQLQALAEQQDELRDAITILGREYLGLRQGNVALLRNETLVSKVVRVTAPSAAPEAVDELLRDANRIALQAIRPDASDPSVQLIQIANADVEQLIEQIQDGEDYAVRIRSAGNYVVGEPCVLAGENCIRVFVDAAPNQVVFAEDESLAAISIVPSSLTNEDLVDRYYFLISAAQFRVRQSGILADTVQIADGRTETVIRFFERLRQQSEFTEVQAVAATTTYTAGPVRIELVALQNGQVLFSTRSRAVPTDPQEEIPENEEIIPNETEFDRNLPPDR